MNQCKFALNWTHWCKLCVEAVLPINRQLTHKFIIYFVSSTAFIYSCFFRLSFSFLLLKLRSVASHKTINDIYTYIFSSRYDHSKANRIARDCHSIIAHFSSSTEIIWLEPSTSPFVYVFKVNFYTKNMLFAYWQLVRITFRIICFKWVSISI